MNQGDCSRSSAGRAHDPHPLCTPKTTSSAQLQLQLTAAVTELEKLLKRWELADGVTAPCLPPPASAQVNVIQGAPLLSFSRAKQAAAHATQQQRTHDYEVSYVVHFPLLPSAEPTQRAARSST